MTTAESRFAVDTNIIVRFIQTRSVHHRAVVHAINSLSARGIEVLAPAQCFVEFRSLATRPIDKNGLAWSAADADAELSRLRALFAILPETPELYESWEGLVAEYAVIGTQVYDARIVACLRVNGIQNLLTLDGKHFKRYAGIIVKAPEEVLE